MSVFDYLRLGQKPSLFVLEVRTCRLFELQNCVLRECSCFAFGLLQLRAPAKRVCKLLSRGGGRVISITSGSCVGVRILGIRLTEAIIFVVEFGTSLYLVEAEAKAYGSD